MGMCSSSNNSMILIHACRTANNKKALNILKNSNDFMIKKYITMNGYSSSYNYTGYFNAIKKYCNKYNYDLYYMHNYIDYESTTLQAAILNGMEEVAVYILKYPNECFLCEKTGYFTALMSAIIVKNKNIAMEILKYPNLCNIGMRTNQNESALIQACRENMSDIAIKILEYPVKAGIYIISNYDKNTALTYACRNNMSDVAMRILEFPNKNYINHVNTEGNSALLYAKVNNMIEVEKKINKLINT